MAIKKLNKVRKEPEVPVTPETFIVISLIGKYALEGKEIDADKREIAELCAGLSLFRKALGGEGTFHEEEAVELAFYRDFWRGLAYGLFLGKFQARFNEENALLIGLEGQFEEEGV